MAEKGGRCNEITEKEQKNIRIGSISTGSERGEEVTDHQRFSEENRDIAA